MKLFIYLILFFSFLDAKIEDFTKNEDVKRFIESFSKESSYTKKSLLKLFSKVEVQKLSLDYYTKEVKKDFEVKGTFLASWDKYENKIINEQRVKNGLKFMQKYRKYFLKAQKEYKIPSTYITAIIGIETHFGSYMGRQNVFDCLTSLAFKKNRRNKFFKRQLKAYLTLAKENKIDIATQKGSFAGAIGLAQFMPSSFMAYAVDFDNDGKIDLNNGADAIGSIANFLKKLGWNSKIPVATRVSYKGNRFTKYKTGLNQNYDRKDLKGIKPKSKDFFYNDKVYLLKLSRENYDELWYGTKNYKVISKYNRSVYYVMGVYQLAKEIRTAYLNQK